MFGLSVGRNGEENVILTEGLGLEERSSGYRTEGGKVTLKSLGGELYFEEPDLEGFVERLERYEGGVELVNGILEDFRGGKMVRFFDPDGNLIEVRTPG